MPTVILFKTTDHVTAHVHNVSCPLVAAARKSRGLIRVIPTSDAVIADLSGRGWTIKHCKCSKA
jgi:hypothetical protein